MPASPERPVAVLVAVTDHARRRAWSTALASAGYAPRPVTRAAEVAKALVDGAVCLAVAVTAAHDDPLTGAEPITVHRFPADISMTALVDGVRASLAGPTPAGPPTNRHP